MVSAKRDQALFRAFTCPRRDEFRYISTRVDPEKYGYVWNHTEADGSCRAPALGMLIFIIIIIF